MRRRRKSVIASSVAAAIFLLTNHPALADSPELITDRPDQTESSVTVPPGYWQLESGWTYTRDREKGREVETHELPGTLLRLGIFEGLELRLGWTGWVFEDRGEAGFSERGDGSGDGELGFKWVLSEGKKGGPSISLLAATSLPSGDRDFGGERWDPSFRLTFAHPLSARTELAYNLGLEWASEESMQRLHTLSNLIYTVALGIDLAARWGIFLEVFGHEAASARGPAESSFDAGVTWLLRDNFQLDLAAGFGLNDQAPDSFIGIGFSYLSSR